MLVLLGIIVAALCINYALRRYLAREQSTPVVQHEQRVDAAASTRKQPMVSIAPVEIVRRWGHESEADVNTPIYGPVHEEIRAILKKYKYVGPDEYFHPIDRSLGFAPWRDNNYVQIGSWGDGSELLARRDISDPRIYINDYEDTNLQPVIFANNVNDLLLKAWKHNEDSLTSTE